jgi:hypothetical protein
LTELLARRTPPERLSRSVWHVDDIFFNVLPASLEDTNDALRRELLSAARAFRTAQHR